MRPWREQSVIAAVQGNVGLLFIFVRVVGKTSWVWFVFIHFLGFRLGRDGLSSELDRVSNGGIDGESLKTYGMLTGQFSTEGL